MSGIMIDFNELTGAISVGPIPKACRESKGKSLLLLSDDYIALDLETTGLDPNFDEIIEIGAVKILDGKIVDRFQSLIHPEEELNPFIEELTGISNEMLAAAPPLSEVLPSFLRFIGNTTLLGHNVNFDINFLYDFCCYLGLPPISNDFIDTMRISRRLYAGWPNHKLKTMVAQLNIGDTVEHRALSDCIQTFQAYEIMKEYAISNNIEITPATSRSSSHYGSLSKSISAQTDTFDPDSPIFGRSFAFTGALSKMTREEAMQAVVNRGGLIGDGVTRKTNYLVLGNNDYCKTIKDGKSSKQKKAEELQLKGFDIATITENVFYDMLEESE